MGTMWRTSVGKEERIGESQICTSAYLSVRPDEGRGGRQDLAALLSGLLAPAAAAGRVAPAPCGAPGRPGCGGGGVGVPWGRACRRAGKLPGTFRRVGERGGRGCGCGCDCEGVRGEGVPAAGGGIPPVHPPEQGALLCVKVRCRVSKPGQGLCCA